MLTNYEVEFNKKEFIDVFKTLTKLTAVTQYLLNQNYSVYFLSQNGRGKIQENLNSYDLFYFTEREECQIECDNLEGVLMSIIDFMNNPELELNTFEERVYH